MLSLIIIICALALELFYESVDRFKGYGWFNKYRGWVIAFYRDSKAWNGTTGVLSVVAGPFLLVFIIQSLMQISGGLAIVLYFLAALFVLVYCLQFQRLENLVDQVELHRGTHSDKAHASEQAVADLARGVGEPAGQRTNHILVKAVLAQPVERLLGVLFWFLILGPAGALLYRMSELLANDSVNDLDDDSGNGPDVAADDFNANAQRLFGLLSWIPTRLSALGYALAGGFEDAIHNWREIDDQQVGSPNYNSVEKNREVLYQSGAGAIFIQRYYSRENPDDEKKHLSFDGVKAAQGLVMRTLLIWMAVLILMTLTGWLG